MDDFTILEGLINSQSAYVAITYFVSALIFTVGLIIGGIAISRYRLLADGKATVFSAVFLTFLSAIMISAPRVLIPVLSESLLSNQTPSAVTAMLSESQESVLLPGIAEAIKTCLLFIKMLGMIAVFRGFLMLKAMADSKESNSYLSKAFTHIIGGVLAINVEFTAQMLTSTFYKDLPTIF